MEAEKQSKTCKLEGCDSPKALKSSGYCNKHHLRWKRHCDPNHVTRHRHLTPEAKAEAVRGWRRINYERNKEAYKARAAKWREDNPERYKKRCEEYFSRPDVLELSRQRTREWVAKNPERKKEQDRQFNANNRGLVASYKALRRARQKQATPPWLTPEHHKKIRSLYRRAAYLTKTTGTPYHVDHIIPLAGREVSGLHTPDNLQVIPKTDNLKKSNKLL